MKFRSTASFILDEERPQVNRHDFVGYVAFRERNENENGNGKYSFHGSIFGFGTGTENGHELSRRNGFRNGNGLQERVFFPFLEYMARKFKKKFIDLSGSDNFLKSQLHPYSSSTDEDFPM